MKKRFIFSEMVFSVLLVIALIHLSIHLSIFGSLISGTGEKGISGLSVGNYNVGEEVDGDEVWFSFSRIFVFVEWMFVGFIVLFLHFRQKSGTDEEYEKVKIFLNSRVIGTETDLDRLYEVLKIMKSIRLSTISRSFSVNKEVAMDWCKTLEMGNFASIEYPRFGEITLVLEEPEKDEEEVKDEKEK